MVVGPTGWGTCIRTVSSPDVIFSLACWKHTIATDASSYDIAIYDALTGSQTAILSGHTDHVESLAFSSDGTLLISGSMDKTIKLWDVQTGGVAKTLCGHTDRVVSVSISTDSTMIASGSHDRTVCLWNVETGDCLTVGRHTGWVMTVSFSPTNSQILLSSCSNNIVQQWSIDGHQIDSPITGSHVTFSPDGNQFVSCTGKTVTSRNTDSRMTVLQFNVANNASYCHFSPDGRFIAVAAKSAIYLWDVTGSDPHLFQTLTGHIGNITSLAFSSFLLISTSMGRTFNFWQIDPSLTSPSVSSPESPLPTSNPTKAVSLQVKDNLAFSVDSEGVVKIWDIVTGLCKEVIITPAKDMYYGDIQVIDSGLAISWCMGEDVYFWNAQQDQVQEVGIRDAQLGALRISGDGSRVFYVDGHKLRSWSIETKECISMDSGSSKYFLDPLRMNDSKVLVQLGVSSTEVLDFGAPGSTCIQSSGLSLDRPQLNLVDNRIWSSGPVQIEDSGTGKVLFQLYGKYREPSAIQWDGQYLIAGYASGEVLMLDFGQMFTE